MLIGFMSNLVFAYLFHIKFIENTKENINGFKELLAIFAIICIWPLASEYKKIGVRITEIKHYIEESDIKSEG
jgi:uncharacterized PurR-regulated membrane protein YhhQ (DUF165 family)